MVEKTVDGSVEKDESAERDAMMRKWWVKTNVTMLFLSTKIIITNNYVVMMSVDSLLLNTSLSLVNCPNTRGDTAVAPYELKK